MTEATAPGKVILFGEHAVVYGRPAIAVPVTRVCATARVVAGQEGFHIVAPDLKKRYRLDEAPPDDPLAVTVRNVLARLKIEPVPDLTLTISSSIPLARGLGSSAAVATAIVRALAQHFGAQWTPDVISSLVFQTEVLLHGTPSGIDNTVIAYEQPVYFVRGRPMERFTVGAPFHLLIADTGVSSPTRAVVEAVRRAWQADPSTYEALFDRIGALVARARQAIEVGDHPTLGRLMDENHRLLQALDVSSPQLDRMVEAAKAAGALGAKLSGAGRGGNMIALVTQETADAVAAALQTAGAVALIRTQVA